MSMADLKHFITKSMVETSKLDACFDIFLVEVREIRGVALHEVLNFSEYRGKNAGKLRKAAGTLRKNIDSLLPGFLNLPAGSNILEDEKLKQKLHDRVYRLASGNRYLSNSEFGKQSYYASQKSILDTLVSRCSRQSLHGGDKSEPVSLSQIAFEKSCQELGQLISGEKASATFACGGAVSIGDNLPPGTHDVSPPVRISWTAKDGSCLHQVMLAITGGSPVGTERLTQLVFDCEVASFGKGEKNIVDLTYRNAGKIDPSQFLNSFHPADFKILDDVEQLLVPSFNCLRESQLPFRRLKAELYKLNGQTATFRNMSTPLDPKRRLGLSLFAYRLHSKVED
ncbi:hypothetical protein PMG11_09820 [Penicillium brasilianum]|uniref:Uncharacterized protein n=1 Tax=Penicillium brasilianum TaxID=104259 RepID=A0A0F7TX67_PENBI|nr:hypothetical protein PMG11_09820 [Penicillium brasilianum]